MKDIDTFASSLTLDCDARANAFTHTSSSRDLIVIDINDKASPVLTVYVDSKREALG